MDWKNYENLSMLSDFYEFTMMNGYLENNMEDEYAYFDLYFRRIPDNGGFVIVAGLEEVVKYIQNLKFDEKDIEYFKSKNMFSEKFLDYLRNFKFECDVWAMPEGSVAFPNEPLMIVRGPAPQAQLIETFALLSINHQSLIATKTNRIVHAAEGRVVMEFGARRAQGVDATVLGARAAFIGGATATSNTLTDITYDVPAFGTMAHSWIMMFDSEYEAFKKYAEIFPNSCSLLVDTYNVLKSGVPNAIKVFDEVLKPRGIQNMSIRIDSGDLAYLSKQARKMLDDAGYENCQIMASNSLDEYTISDLIEQGAKLDGFGVGERLITAKSDPVLGGVYKLCAVEKSNGEIIPKIKISENIEKITTPGFKTVYRIYDKNSGKAEADLITLHDEKIDESKDLEIFHPIHTWKRKTLTNFTTKELLVRVFDKGELVYDLPTLDKIIERKNEQIAEQWEEVKRFEHPHLFHVDLSQKLWDIKYNLLMQSK